MSPTERQLRTFKGLRDVVATLRGPGGCPWDRVQTHQSLRPYLLEEAHETLEALDLEDRRMLCEELGDLLLEVLLHVQIAEENEDFSLEDVVYSISQKLVRRHPHVFGDAIAETPEAVVEQWDRLKSKERGQDSAIAGIPLTLPALAQAQAIQRRASRAGFKFESVEQVWEALHEELDELRDATPVERAGEVGDVLFAVTNLARWYEIDGEDALRDTSRRFSTTFTAMETMVRDEGVNLDALPLEDKLALWERAKAESNA